VPYEPQTMVSGPPSEHECHNNVERWVSEHPDHKAVRGWLVFDLLGRFTAHSVVEAPDGRLFDLTPAPLASQRYPFLRHHGPDIEFEAIVRAGFVHLDFHS
jgi:hypothetical protein